MSDNHEKPFGQDHPYGAPEPERFEAPRHHEPEPPAGSHAEPELVTPTYAYAPSPVDPVHPPVEPRVIETEPLPGDPLLPSDPGADAIAMPPERLALDGTSLWLNRLGEELV